MPLNCTFRRIGPAVRSRPSASSSGFPTTLAVTSRPPAAVTRHRLIPAVRSRPSASSSGFPTTLAVTSRPPAAVTRHRLIPAVRSRPPVTAPPAKTSSAPCPAPQKNPPSLANPRLRPTFRGLGHPRPLVGWTFLPLPATRLQISDGGEGRSDPAHISTSPARHCAQAKLLYRGRG